MKKILFMIFLLICLILLSPLYIFIPRKVHEISQFNVIIIILDAASASHFSIYGYPLITTPNIDNFAKKSIVFKNAFTTSVFSRGSGASLFTSLYEGSHRIFDFSNTLPLEAKTLAEVLHENGFTTAMFTASGNVSHYSGLNQGFINYKELLGANPENITQTVLEWIKTNNKKRFFIYAHYRQPHDPFDAPFEIRKRLTPPQLHKYLDDSKLIDKVYASQVTDPEQIQYFISQYDANLSYADWGIAPLLSYISSTDLSKNTIVIITSDHGEAMGEHISLGLKWFGHNYDVHRQSIQIPLIIYFPLNNYGYYIPQIVENIDIMPTLIDLMNLKGAPFYIQGKSFAACFHDQLCYTKGFSFTLSTKKRYVSVIDSNYHTILDVKTNAMELFAAISDAEEIYNLADSNRRTARFYRSAIKRFLATNRRLSKHLYSSWRVRNIELSPEAIENLKTLGYLK